MRNFPLIIFLLVLPALIILGHDTYMAFFTETDLSLTDRFWPSDIGWLWVQYAPDSYNMALASIDPQSWAQFIDPLLQQSAVIIALVPLAIFLGILGLLKLFGIGPYIGQGIIANLGKAKTKKSSYSPKKKKQSGKAQYKRK